MTYTKNKNYDLYIFQKKNTNNMKTVYFRYLHLSYVLCMWNKNRYVYIIYLDDRAQNRLEEVIIAM